MEKSGNLFKIVKKYIKRDVAIPDLILTRIEKREEIEWEEYYKEFDDSFRELHQNIPKKTAIILNCQINPKVTLLVAGEPLKLSMNIRNPCFFLAVWMISAVLFFIFHVVFKKEILGWVDLFDLK